MKFSKKVLAISESPTLAMMAKVRSLKASGIDVISLAIGEPDWNTVQEAKNAGIEAIKNNFTKYTAPAGISELRQAIIDDFNLEYGFDYSIDNVCVTAGAKLAIYAALQVLCEREDEVLIPSPYWVSYPEMVKLVDAKPIILATKKENQFKITAEQIQLNEKSRLLLLCSPNNPTGLSYTEKELSPLIKILEKNPQFMVLSDDIYNQLVFNGAKFAPHLLKLAPHLKEQVISISGASKTYSMTGWRVGWTIGPKLFSKHMADLVGQMTTNTTSISQMAALAAIKKSGPEVKQIIDTLKRKCDSFCNQINLIPGFRAIKPDGAFYIWTDISDFYKNPLLKNSKDIAQILLEEFYVAVIPGEEFGMDGYLRLSFAISEEQIDRTLIRFRSFSQKYS